jgi:hypothetical protein
MPGGECAQEVLADQQQIVLSEDEAARFPDALDAVDQDTVARLRELSERVWTAGFASTERYDAARHDVTGFSCGNEPLDRWLVRYAGQNCPRSSCARRRRKCFRRSIRDLASERSATRHEP